MSKSEKNLFQVRLSEEERRFIKSIAASQGMTHQEAVVAAFAAWAEELQALDSPAALPPAQADNPVAGGLQLAPKGKAARQTSPAWLQKAAKLDWTKCPEVEMMLGKDRRLWVLRGTFAPLTEVLQAAAEGNPADDLAEIFAVKPSQLAKVLKFAGAPPVND
jgi:hypothetical protein